MRRTLIYTITALAVVCASCRYSDPGYIEPSGDIYGNWKDRMEQYTEVAGDVFNTVYLLEQGDTAQAEEYMKKRLLTLQDWHLPLSEANTWTISGNTTKYYPGNLELKSFSCTLSQPDTYTIQCITDDLFQEYFTLTMHKTADTEYLLTGSGQLCAQPKDKRGMYEPPVYDSGVFIRFTLSNSTIRLSSSVYPCIAQLTDIYADLTAVNGFTSEEVDVHIENNNIVR
ncbi:MAG: hypothetical protein IJ776_04980 [Paludibacteraceae bacterium]|nr:hypothetical protein [Paludibacteraceae bacterium]